MVRQLQAIGNRFAPFFKAVADAMAAGSSGGHSNEADSGDSSHTAAALEAMPLAVAVLSRILTVTGCVVAVYALSYIVRTVVGREIIIHEEVFMQDDDDDDEKRPKELIVERPKRRSARDKKDT